MTLTGTPAPLVVSLVTVSTATMLVADGSNARKLTSQGLCPALDSRVTGISRAEPLTGWNCGGRRGAGH
jgi:hypothetical protein